MNSFIEIALPRKKTGVVLVFKEEEEKALVEKAKRDPQAFGLLFEKYYDRIYLYILHRTADKDLSEDLTSETFFKALDKLWTFRWMSLPFSAWLYRIATNEVNGYYRKNKKIRRESLNNVEDEKSPESVNSFDKEESSEKVFVQLHKAISSLKPKYQEVVVLRYFEEKSIKEISVILDKAEGTVKSLIHRALTKLENLIDKELYKEFKDE